MLELEIHGSTVSRALKVEGGRRGPAPKGGTLSRTIATETRARDTGHEEPARGYGGNADRTGDRRREKGEGNRAA